ncbi:putative bifunctional TENA-E protein [Apium graveolens]|uniref:putative bifunctional TENA-E protein n=1 Tax=Apium graveolens TaxID=4045 RepID=UPI003D7B11ED
MEWEASEVEAEKFKSNKTNITESWVKKHTSIYKQATRHPFILSIKDGTIDSSSFKIWLGQDYIYVRAFVPFVASVLVKACEESDDSSDMDIILGGMASLNDEIAWFKEEASRWEVSLTSDIPQRANLMYCSFLKRLMSSEIEYAVAITAFWAIETVYQVSFSHCLEDRSKIPDELKDTCQRWGNSGFSQYCHSLQNIADRCLEKASIDIIAKAEQVFVTVLEHEIEFWNMSKGEI